MSTATIGTKRFLALARVSSREQEREGFSLAVQEEALRRYAAAVGGEIVRLFRIAETASRADERRTFKELIALAKRTAGELDGLLFYKVDRAARNLFDYVELERLETEHHVPFISVSQPTEGNPAGRMMRRTLANMASFYTEQLAVDVREGMARRVREGWFVSRAPYGYRNVRVDGRCVTQTDPAAAVVVRRIFQLYAYEPLTLDGLRERLMAEGVVYRPESPGFARSKLHAVLTDRSYLGEVAYKGEWMPGKHEPLVDRAVWERVQVLLGARRYQSHQMTFAGGFMTCGHCGRVITGERITRRSAGGARQYIYYRCSGYTAPGHPRVRLPEAELDRQVVELFGRMRIQDHGIRDWFREVLVAQTRHAQRGAAAEREELSRQASLVVGQQDRLLNLRLGDQVDQETFARKHTELRDRLAAIKLRLDALDRSHDETAELVAKVFELSQTLQNKWESADYAAKRRILEIVCLNSKLDGASAVFTTRKPFDVLVEGLNSGESWGSRI